MDALKRLKIQQGFIYRYSMLNFVELASLCDPRPLHSAEMVFMKAVGLYHFLGPKWIANESEIAGTLRSLVHANDLAELRTVGFSPEHYKKLRELDGEWFLDFVAKAKETGGLPDGSTNWAKWLGRFYSYWFFEQVVQKRLFQALGEVNRSG